MALFLFRIVLILEEIHRRQSNLCRIVWNMLRSWPDGHRIFVNSFAGKVRGENTRKAIEQNMKEWIPKDNVFVVGVKIYT